MCLKVRHLSPLALSKARQPVLCDLGDRCAPQKHIGHKVPNPRTNAKAMSRKTGGQRETRQPDLCVDHRHTIWSAIDLTRPGGLQRGILQRRQQALAALQGGPDRAAVGPWIKDARTLHRGGGVQLPMCCSVKARAPRLRPTWGQRTPTPGKHRQEMFGPAQHPRCRIDLGQPRDGKGIAPIAATGDRHCLGVQRIGQPLGPWRNRQDRAANRGLGKKDPHFRQKTACPRATRQNHLPCRDCSFFGDDTRHCAAALFQTARGAALHDMPAARKNATRDGGCGGGGICNPICWGPDTARPAPLRRAWPLRQRSASLYRCPGFVRICPNGPSRPVRPHRCSDTKARSGESRSPGRNRASILPTEQDCGWPTTVLLRRGSVDDTSPSCGWIVPRRSGPFPAAQPAARPEPAKRPCRPRQCHRRSQRHRPGLAVGPRSVYAKGVRSLGAP